MKMLTLHQTNLSVTPGDMKTTLRRSWCCPIKSQIQCLITRTCSIHHTILSSIQIQKSLEKTLQISHIFRYDRPRLDSIPELPKKKKNQIAFYFIYSFFRICKQFEIFADVIKLKILRWDDHELTKWALNPMTNVFRSDKWGERQKRRSSCENGGSDWSDVATSQGMPGATRNWKKQRILPLEASEGVWPSWHLNFRLLTSRTVTE